MLADYILKVILFSLLLIISICDIKTHHIPPKLTVLLLGICLVYRFEIGGEIIKSLISSIAICAVLLVLFYLSYGRWIGGGDVKLISSTSICLEFDGEMRALLYAIILVWLYYFFIDRSNTEKICIPLAPFISLGMFLEIFFAQCGIY